MFLRIFQHLLPNARAWRLTISKQLREFFEGLTSLGTDVREFVDLVWLDLFPDSTRELGNWEKQFGLSGAGLSDEERREKVDAAWKALGGQDPRYIQDTLQASGFNVFLHKWWVPGTEPAVNVKSCVVARDPRLYLSGGFGGGYPLVNKIFTTKRIVLTQCGEPAMQCGEPTALCGNYVDFQNIPKENVIPNDPDKWPYFLYIGAETFPDLAEIAPSRQSEFEELCLKICPAQQWIGILASYFEGGFNSKALNLEDARYESLNFIEGGSSALDLSTALYESLDFIEGGSSTLDLSTAFYEDGST